MFAVLQSQSSLLIATGLLCGTLTCSGQQLVVITPPANEPYNLNKNDPPVADTVTIGSQLNGTQVTGIPLLITSSAPWLGLDSDCTSPGTSSIGVSTTATVNFCVDPSQTGGNGYYVGLIRVTTPTDNYPPLTVPVNLSRFPTGDLSPDPSSVPLNASHLNAAVSISEDPGGSAQGGPITVMGQLGLPNSPDGNWLQFNLKNANVKPGAPGEIDIQAVPANLTSQAAATYANTIVLTDSFGDTKAITVTYKAQPATVGQPVRSFAHLAPQPPFATQIVLTNTSGQSANFTLKFFHDDGSSFSVPVTTTSGTGMMDTIADSIAAHGTNYYELSNASPDAANIWGSAQLSAPDGVAGVAIFRNVPDAKSYYEAAVPLSSGSTAFVAPFDQTVSSVTHQHFATGFAVANLDSSNPASVNCIGRDGAGHSISNGSLSFSLKPNGHHAATLSGVFNGIRGTLTCTSTAALSGISFRFLGSEFTTLPVVSVP
jgi:hypothetical protein